MCNLDIIAGDGPVYRSQEELWLRWFFSNIQEADFVVALVLFAAVFLMVVSVIALFAVMLLKDRFPKKNNATQDPDGSVHIVPFLISIAASMMFIFGLLVVIGLILLQLPLLDARFSLYSLFTLPYDMVLLYTAFTAVLFTVVLKFSPNGSKLFRDWNRVCRNICLWVMGVLGIVILFFYCFYSFTLLE